jgi:hypothetical protein
VIDADESEAGALVELNAAFWNAGDQEIRQAAAQIVFSLATLEGAQSVTLLRGLTPGPVPGVAQPIIRADLARYRPWLLVRQPVAGALVGDEVPIDVDARIGYPLAIRFAQDGRRSGPVAIGEPRSMRIPEGFEGPGHVVILDRLGSRVSVPVKFAGG